MLNFRWVQLAIASDFDSQVAGSSNDCLQDIISRMEKMAISYNPELEGGKDPYPICCMTLECLPIVDPINFCSAIHDR